MDKKLDLYAVAPDGRHVELVSGYIDERLVQGFLVTMSRFRHYLPIAVYIDRQRVEGFEVLASGVFRMRVRPVQRG